MIRQWKNILAQLVAIWAFMLCGSSASCQEYRVYDYSYKQNKFELISSFVAWGGVHLYDHFRPNEVFDELEEFNTKSLWGFDRGAVAQNSNAARDWSDYALYASIATPVIVTLSSQRIKNDNLGIALLGMQGFFMESSITHMVKIMAERPRPFVYRDAESLINTTVSKNYTKSFYSGHTSSSAYFAFFTAKMFSDIHPDSPAKPFVWGAAIGLPAVTGYLRYKAGRHFPTDIITGYAVGATLGVLIPSFYNNDHFSLAASANGMSLTLTF